MKIRCPIPIRYAYMRTFLGGVCLTGNGKILLVYLSGYFSYSCGSVYKTLISFAIVLRASHSLPQNQKKKFKLKLQSKLQSRAHSIMEWISMEKELEEDFFHDARGPYNYCTVPGERWNCSKIYLFEGRGYIRDSINFTGDKLYLKCRKSHRKHNPCKGRAIVEGVYLCIFPSLLDFGYVNRDTLVIALVGFLNK